VGNLWALQPTGNDFAMLRLVFVGAAAADWRHTAFGWSINEMSHGPMIEAVSGQTQRFVAQSQQRCF
jgi:hypothetical protein